MASRRVDLVDLALPLLGQQPLAHLLVQRIELLLAGRGDRPRLGSGEGRVGEESRGRGQDVQAQRGEVKGVGVEVEEAGAGRLCAACC